MTQQRIAKDDLVRNLNKLQDRVQGNVEAKKQSLMTGVAVGGVVLMLIFFLLGKRSGKKKTTFVEIRRI